MEAVFSAQRLCFAAPWSLALLSEAAANCKFKANSKQSRLRMHGVSASDSLPQLRAPAFELKRRLALKLHR